MLVIVVHYNEPDGRRPRRLRGSFECCGRQQARVQLSPMGLP